MTNVKSPNEAISEHKAEVVKKNLGQVYDLEQAIERSLLKAHATGLEVAAALIGEAADELAKMQQDREKDRKEGEVEDPAVTAATVAVSRALADLNDKIMARVKNVSVMTSVTQLV